MILMVPPLSAGVGRFVFGWIGRGRGVVDVGWVGWGEVGCCGDVGVVGMRSIWIRLSSAHPHLIAGAYRPGAEEM